MKFRYLLGTAVVIGVAVGLRMVERAWDAFLLDGDYAEVYDDDDDCLTVRQPARGRVCQG